MKPLRTTLATLGGASVLLGTMGISSGPELAPYQEGDEKLGGDTTVYEVGRNAFSLPAANMASERQTRFFVGNSFFKKAWVEAPSSTTARDGLGPHFIARSCGACHALDGRGATPAFDNGLQSEQPMALLFRLSIPAAGGSQPEPRYGGQFNNDAIPGVKPEGKVQVSYQPLVGSFPDGEPFELLQPQYRFTELGYGPLHPQVQVSPRIAPDGKTMAFITRRDGAFRLAAMDLASRQVQVLTDSNKDESPSFAPNGRMILIATELGGRGVLSAVSTDGRIKQKLSIPAGDVREPAWGPFTR